MVTPPAFAYGVAHSERVGGILSVEEKLLCWLATIPDPGRQWDDGQISKIAMFAQDSNVNHFPAEEIYRRYVVFQVEEADGISDAGE